MKRKQRSPSLLLSPNHFPSEQFSLPFAPLGSPFPPYGCGSGETRPPHEAAIFTKTPFQTPLEWNQRSLDPTDHQFERPRKRVHLGSPPDRPAALPPPALNLLNAKPIGSPLEKEVEMLSPPPRPGTTLGPPNDLPTSPRTSLLQNLNTLDLVLSKEVNHWLERQQQDLLQREFSSCLLPGPLVGPAKENWQIVVYQEPKPSAGQSTSSLDAPSDSMVITQDPTEDSSSNDSMAQEPFS
eukprot:TRINITY_DN9814_c1_g3_i1.p1 TRINITY_DN9814_c1_g3~~TRINITY_DN9814_c1_g3_i1.p1  ORF type:complete len:239 (+),score=33.61 TRINITY_DN9814_c1_g3_i1:32-748(+)